MAERNQPAAVTLAVKVDEQWQDRVTDADEASIAALDVNPQDIVFGHILTTNGATAAARSIASETE